MNVAVELVWLVALAMSQATCGPSEDSHPMTWYAAECGNGQGSSFIQLSEHTRYNLPLYNS